MSSSSVSQKLTFDKLGDLFVDNLWLFLVGRGPSSVHDVHRKPGHLDVGDDYLDDVDDYNMHFYHCTTTTDHDYQINGSNRIKSSFVGCRELPLGTFPWVLSTYS